MTVSTPSPKGSVKTAELMQAVAGLAEARGCFGAVRATESMVECRAKQCPDEAAYRLAIEDGRLYVSWLSVDRYLSQSIEADLMWTGDDLDELFAEELADLGWSGGALGGVEHYRSGEKMFTFRSAVPLDPERLDPARDAPALVNCLLAYEAVFSQLGDMKDDDE